MGTTQVGTTSPWINQSRSVQDLQTRSKLTRGCFLQQSYKTYELDPYRDAHSAAAFQVNPIHVLRAEFLENRSTDILSQWLWEQTVNSIAPGAASVDSGSLARGSELCTKVWVNASELLVSRVVPRVILTRYTRVESRLVSRTLVEVELSRTPPLGFAK